MDLYQLSNVAPQLLTFLNELSKWYVKLNRARVKGEEGAKDWTISLNILVETLLNTCIAIASYVPFISELFYQNLRKVIPESNKNYHE